MAKIEYVKAWGLWSHFESYFMLSPSLTVVTGPNGSGKSSLLRIIKWVALGEPSGENFIFKVEDEDTKEVLKQSEEGRAEIGLDNGVVITKTRRKGKTTHTISTIAEPFEKAEVPQEIKDALGITKYKFGDFETYLNFAFQLEAPFLLSESPSVGAKVLGKLAGTEAVDLAIGEATKRTSRTQKLISTAKKDVEISYGDLLEYQDLDDLQQQLKACEFLVEELDNNASKRQTLAELTNLLIRSRDSLETLETELVKLAIVPDLALDLKNIDQAQQRYDDLLSLYGQLDSSIQTIDDLAAQLVNFEGLNVAALLMDSLDAIERRLSTIQSLSTELISYTQAIKEAEDFLETTKGLDVAALLVDSAETTDRRLTTITKLSTDLLSYKQAIKEADDFLQTTKDLDVAADNLGHVEKHAARMDKLRNLYGEHTIASSQVTRLTKDITGLEGVKEAADLVTAAGLSIGRLDTLRQLGREYTVKADTVISSVAELGAAVKAQGYAEDELSKAWEAAGGKCPLCDQAVDTHSH